MFFERAIGLFMSRNQLVHFAYADFEQVCVACGFVFVSLEHLLLCWKLWIECELSVCVAHDCTYATTSTGDNALVP